MPRSRRLTPGGYVYHVLNRGNNRQLLFEDDADYAAFLAIVAQVMQRVPMRLLGYCVMPNHWHMVLWPRPRNDGDLARFMQRLTVTHARRWQLHRHCVGQGHVYQGLYKSFPVQEDGHLATVCRYVERNALRAKMVRRAEHWQWSSLWQLTHATEATAAVSETKLPPLTDWPIDRPGRSIRGWVKYVNQPQTAADTRRWRCRSAAADRLATSVGRRVWRASWNSPPPSAPAAAPGRGPIKLDSSPFLLRAIKPRYFVASRRNTTGPAVEHLLEYFVARLNDVPQHAAENLLLSNGSHYVVNPTNKE